MKKPNQYIQKRNCLEDIQKYIKGDKVLILLGAFNAEEFKKKITQSLRIPYTCIVYDKECTQGNVEELANQMKEGSYTTIIGFGGGKILDVAKAVSYYYDCELVIIPSSASMDGACSALSVLYHDDHSFDRFIELPKNPDVVIVDSQVIFDAPFHLLCAGMADAISSYYDVMYVLQTRQLEEEVIACAKRCHDIVFAHYQKVKDDFANKVLSEEVEAMITRNIYDSAIAFENAECEFSHVLANATTKVPDSKGMHGERVGVSTLFQLALENKQEEFDKVKKLLLALGMPTLLEDLNIDEKEILLISMEEEFAQLHICYSLKEMREALKYV